MFSLTYLRVTARGPEIVVLSHPNERVAKSVHDAFMLVGVHTRLWRGYGGKNPVLIPKPLTEVKPDPEKTLALVPYHWLNTWRGTWWRWGSMTCLGLCFWAAWWHFYH